MAIPSTQFSLVLLGRFPGRDKPVAAALARDFAHDETWGLQVLGAAPIVLLDGLTAEQAQAIHAAVGDVEGAGSRVEIQPGLDPGLPKLAWPTPPRIKGKLASEYGAPAAPAAPGGAPATTVSLIVPCPYTGQKMKLSISVSVTAAGEVAATAAAAPLPIPVPQAPIHIPHPSPTASRQPSSGAAAYKPIPTPVALSAIPMPRPPTSGSPVPRGPTAVRRPTPSAGGPAQPPAPEPVIQGLEDLDELQPMPQAPVPAADHSPTPQPPPPQPRPPTRAAPAMVPAPSPRPPMPVPAAQPGRQSAMRPPVPSGAPLPVPAAQVGRQSGQIALRPPAPSGAPLPDVPVLQGPPMPAAPTNVTEAMGNQAQPPLPADLMGAPMDLSAFEANVTASGILRSVGAPAGAQPAQPTPVAAPAAEAGPEDDGSLWSVFMGKSNNPRVHQVVAELQGISVQEAARLCQKPVVALAKDVPSAKAKGIKQQMAAVNIPVRLTRRN